MTASRQGFRPAQLRVSRGDTLKLELRASDEEHCFAIDELRIAKRIRTDRATSADLTPERTGTLGFYCCLHAEAAAERGKLVVE